MVFSKKVKTKSDLNSLALETGASIEGAAGTKFNAQKRQAAKPKRLEKNPDAVQLPKAEPPPAPPAPDPGIAALAIQIEAASKGHLMMMAELKKQISEIQMNAAEPPMEWEFEFIRDDSGFLINLLAHGARPTKTLN